METSHFMNLFKLNTLGLTITTALLLSLPAHAGGVSDGGGRTTNPNPANPERIVGTARQTTGLALVSWLNAEEGNFNRLDSNARATSPFRKLFVPGRNIFDVIHETSIELRMSAPCLDAQGTPWDGSIYPTAPNAICISPFTMAPKLTEMNYDIETVALIAHELSHLLGTTEEEARAIQQSAIYALGHVDLIDLAVKLDLLAGKLGVSDGKFSWVDLELSTLSDFANTYDASDRSMMELTELRDALRFNFLKTQAVSETTLDAFQAQFIRLRMIQFGGCVLSPQESSGISTYCTQELNRSFAGNSSATAQEISNHGISSMIPGGDQVTIQRTDSTPALKTEVQALRSFLKTVWDEVKSVQNTQFNLIRVN